MKISQSKLNLKYNKSNIIMLFAIILQIAFFAFYLLKKEMHMDEVMLLLNARSIADNGTDAFGTKMPIYFETWLYGGQSPLPTYVVALVIKLFGYHLWLTRLPLLLLSFGSLFATKKLFDDLLDDNKTVQIIALALVAIQPWRLFQSAWTLDCAYFPHFFIIAVYFLNKAVNSSKKLPNFLLAMLFFAFGCYSYLLSLFFVAVFLIVYYILMMKRRKITFAQTVYSAVALVVLVAPMLLYVLILLNVVNKSFSIFGFTIATNGYYKRLGDTAFGNASTPIQVLKNLAVNFATNIVQVFLPDRQIVYSQLSSNWQMNAGILQYGHIFGAITLLIGLFAMLFKRKKFFSKPLKSNTKVFFISCAITMLLFLTFTSDVLLGTYRYACFFTVINIFSAIGITYLIKLAGKMQKYLKLLVVALMIVSVAISACGVDSFVGDRTNSLSSSSCSDTFDYLQKNNIKKITVAYVDAESPSVKKYQARISVLLRFKYYDQKDSFQPLINELAYAYHDDYYSQLAEQAVRDENSNVLVKTDGSIVFCTLTSTDKLTDECYLFLNDAYSKLTDLNTDGYSVIQMGFFTILIKQ